MVGGGRSALAALLCYLGTELKPKSHAPAAYLLGDANQHKQEASSTEQRASRGVPYEGAKKEPFPSVMPEESTDLLRAADPSFTPQTIIICHLPYTPLGPADSSEEG